MSQLQEIADLLRALAQDTSPISTDLTSSARQLETVSRQVDALQRSDINVGPLLAALEEAQKRAQRAVDGALKVRQEGEAWADDLARGRGGGGHFTSEGSLQPNTTYQTGEFSYEYETDQLGRIIRFTAKNLRLTARTGRLPHDGATPGKVPGDHAGHLAGDIFGGSPKLDNLVSQSEHVNLSEYKRHEIQWKKALQEGADVSVEVLVEYDGGSLRPFAFIVVYTIDGERHTERIKNEQQ